MPRQVVIDASELIQAMVTVCAGILSLKPAPRPASLATFDVLTSAMTVFKI